MMKKDLLANFAAAIASLTAGTVVVVTSVLVNEIEPATLAGLRYIIALICLAPVLPFVWPKERVSLIDVFKIAALGVIFFGAFTWAFTAALNYTTPARGAIGLATMPIQTLIVAAILGRERFTVRKVASVVFAFIGVAVVFGPEAMQPEGSNYLKGDLLMLFGVFNSSVYIVLSGATIRKFNAPFVTTCAMVFGVLFLFLVALGSGELATLPAISGEGWLALLFIGVVGGAIQFMLFIWALGLLQPTRASIYLVLSPLSAMLLSVIFLHEVITIALVSGMALVVFGIYVNNRREAPV
jgi:drug/metabolite transporter (DMT)-like permease